MKGIIGSAVLGVVLMGAGCRTDGAGATRNTPVVMEQPTQNPSSFERGFSLRGTVDTDYKDMLVIEDEQGQTRNLRISSQTRYFQDGKQIRREFLAPGSSVRASFDDNNLESIAREIHILSTEGEDAPLELPDRDGSPNR